MAVGGHEATHTVSPELSIEQWEEISKLQFISFVIHFYCNLEPLSDILIVINVISLLGWKPSYWMTNINGLAKIADFCYA